MQTTSILAEQFGSAVLIDADLIRSAYFPHLSRRPFEFALDSGEIALPVVRLCASAKSKRMIPLLDMAIFLDAKSDRARIELSRKG